MSEALKQALGKVLKRPVSELDLDVPLGELGLDSLGVVNLVEEVELTTGVSISVQKLAASGSLRSMASSRDVENLTNDSSPPYIVRFAETADERRQALQLRYQVFTLEEEDARYADHDAREYRDAKDTPDSHLVVCLTPDRRIVGTLRVHLRRESEFLGDEHYHWQELAAELGWDRDQLCEQTALIDRGVVERAHRALAVWHSMTDFAEKWLYASGGRVVVVYVSKTNVRMIEIIRKLRYASTSVSGARGSWQGGLYAKIL